MKSFVFLPVLLLTLTAWCTAQSQYPFTFDRPIVIDSENGLPADQVNTLVKDQTGFIWVGTREGLARFDGHEFDVFQHQRNDSTSIPNNWVECLLVDHSNQLWVGTTRGLCRYEAESGSFRPFPEHLDSLLRRERVHALHQDHSNKVWIGTPARLVRLDPHQNELATFTFTVTPQDTTFDTARINGINSVLSDADQEILWVGTLSGLIKFNKTDHSYSWYPNYLENKDAQYLANAIRQLHQLPNGKLLVGTWNGAFLFDPYSKTFEAINDPKATDIKPYRSKVVSFLSMPAYGLVGITYRTGFCWYRYTTQQVVKTYVNNVIEREVYSAHLVDEQQRIWGLNDQGLFQYNPLINQIKASKFPFRNKL